MAAEEADRGSESRGESSTADNAESSGFDEDYPAGNRDESDGTRMVNSGGGEMPIAVGTKAAGSSFGQEGVEGVKADDVAEENGEGRFGAGIMEPTYQPSELGSETAGKVCDGTSGMEVEGKQKGTPLSEAGKSRHRLQKHERSADSKADSYGTKAAMDIDAEVEKLTGALQQMSSNFVPRAVSFGRRRAPGVTRVPTVPHHAAKQSDNLLE